jgi:hypothetical protein
MQVFGGRLSRMEQVATALAMKAGEKIIEKMSSNGKSKKKRNHKPKAPQPRVKKTVNKAKRKRSDFESIAVPSTVVTRMPKYRFSIKQGRYKGQDAHVVVSQDLIGQVPGSLSQYYDALEIPLNPLAISGSRLALYSRLYTKFRFESFTIHFLPTSGTAATGALLMSLIQDPELDPGEQGVIRYIQALMTTPGADSQPVSLPFSFKPKLDSEKGREYYLAPDLEGENRLTLQGIIKIVALNAISTAPGFIWFNYKVVLYEPVLNTEDLNAYVTLNTTSGAPAVNELKVGSPGAWAPMTFQLGAATTKLTVSTKYIVYFNFSVGYLQAFVTYFCITPAVITTSFSLYATASDAVNATSPVSSGIPQGFPPANGQAYFSAVDFASPGLRPVTNNMKRRLQDITTGTTKVPVHIVESQEPSKESQDKARMEQLELELKALSLRMGSSTQLTSKV